MQGLRKMKECMTCSIKGLRSIYEGIGWGPTGLQYSDGLHCGDGITTQVLISESLES